MSTGAMEQLAGILDELGRRIREVSILLNPNPGPVLPDVPALVDVINEFLEKKAAKGVRERYLVQLHHAMVRFSENKWARPINSFKPAEIEEWSNDQGWGPATRLSYLTDVRTLFNWAVKRDYLKNSPMRGIEMPMLEEKEPFIHSPEHVRKFLHTAQAMDKDVMRLYAIQYFAGPRPLSEAAKLTEEEILPSLIEIKGPRSKTRKRRLVTIAPALKAFLKVGGKLPVKNLKRRWLAVRRAAGVPWGQDVVRHTFCSYHLAYFENAAKTALLAAHTEQMLFSKYRATRTADGRLITKRFSKNFWAIRPA